ncbi:MAG TPA: hypothetical protein VFW23_01945 [Tepidisphaeraceae bacterium]|nr:hypothetical protein [Tepidisphaeraceae bacterium]
MGWSKFDNRNFNPSIRGTWITCFLLGLAVFLSAIAWADSNQAYSGPACAAPVDDFFANQVWPKVGAKTCLECHKTGGDADDSDFILLDPQLSQSDQQRDQAMRHNRDQFVRMARTKEGDQSRLLLKVAGKLKHGGKVVLKPDSPGYEVLAKFVAHLYAPADWSAHVTASDKNEPPFFDGVVMLDHRQLLRRVTLSLAGRLPTEQEMSAVEKDGLKVLPPLLDSIMTEDAFYTRLREAFNDIFLTRGFGDNPEDALSYEYFEKSRTWTQKFDLSGITDPKARQKARYKLHDNYRDAVLGEPMKLVEYIVRNNRPFSEIVTADYIMVSPYSARGYGIYDEVRSQFKNPDDPFEYIPVKLKALKGRSRPSDEDSASGYYPSAGLLTTFQYLRRYPTTETNRNRLRARMLYLQFLGVDVLELAARVSDAAAVTAKFKIPTMQAAECVVCHKTVDPVAGLFQDYWDFNGTYGRRKGGWFTDMFPPGFEGEKLPADQRWRALQWLGERTVKDPRFAEAMVGHAYYLLTGRKVLAPPKDIDDPQFSARRRAYLEQHKEIEAIANRFSKDHFDFKGVIKDWVLSDFYRADGLATAMADPQRRVELDDVGLVRLLSPEQVERKVAAVFGKPWGKLDDQMAMLYGGIDSKEVTERATDPSGAMGAIERILANDVACRETALDFSRPPAERKLFPDVEPDTLPGSSPQADANIRQTIVHLHQRILGRYDAPDSPEVNRTYELFAGIVADAAQRKGIEKEDIWSCRQGLEHPVPDPHYTVRAWRAVVTYLLRRPEFLYE